MDITILTMLTIIATIVSGVLGGWIGATLRSRTQCKLRNEELFWQFRLKLHEAEQQMWQAKFYAEFQAPINWLRVATSDPRINIDNAKIQGYEKSLKVGWRELKEKEEYTDEPGISTKTLKKIEKIRQEIDDTIIERLKR